MINATGLAGLIASIDGNGFRILRSSLLVVVASIVMAACSGGASTAENPITSVPNPGDSPYTGPAALGADALRFQQEFWSKAKTSDRCGACHNEVVGQEPMFVRSDDVNLAYVAALTKVDVLEPASSRIVERVGNGHGCWEEAYGICAAIVTNWIENWVETTGGGAGQVVLTAPESVNPGDSLSFPPDPLTPGLNGANTFASTIYPIVELYCSDCHSSVGEDSQQQPYFADPDIASAYDAAKPKINLDRPDNSRLVIRLRDESHNCWDPPGCAGAAQTMQDAIAAFANFDPTPIDPSLVTSKALKLVDGTPASGSSRYEDTQIALWEFKTGAPSRIAYDTSGVDPAINLTLTPEVTWYGGWGITMNGGQARADTGPSKKIHDVLLESGEFSIEAWVIPANVTQEMTRIVSYSANDMSRNFTLQQNLYDYDFRLRTNAQDANGNSLLDLNGNPPLSTPAADEVLQATLQHVVATYSPVDGRSIYVNGELATNSDPIPGGTFIDWEDTFALVMGGEVSGAGFWNGTIRLAAIHRRALSEDQILQNYDAGVGARYYMLFDISDRIGADALSSYILFEAQQYDSYSYLFDKPHFITLDGSAPEGIPIEGVRIAINGLEAQVGQTYATVVGNLNASEFAESGLGQPLSAVGAVIPLERGPEDDEFFLTFDVLDSFNFDRDPFPTSTIAENDLTPASRIGVKTFDEIDATYSAVTGINRTDYPNTVDMTYRELRQSLPAVEDINTFLSSHQVAIAQLAIEYCNALVNADGNPNPVMGQIFPGFDFDAPQGTAFAPGNRDLFVVPLINQFMGTGIASQPAFADVYDELAAFQNVDPLGRPDNLIDRLLNPPPGADPSDTRDISKGVCAAVLGSAVTLVQ